MRSTYSLTHSLNTILLIQTQKQGSTGIYTYRFSLSKPVRRQCHQFPRRSFSLQSLRENTEQVAQAIHISDFESIEKNGDSCIHYTLYHLHHPLNTRDGDVIIIKSSRASPKTITARCECTHACDSDYVRSKRGGKMSPCNKSSSGRYQTKSNIPRESPLFQKQKDDVPFNHDDRRNYVWEASGWYFERRRKRQRISSLPVFSFHPRLRMMWVNVIQ